MIIAIENTVELVIKKLHIIMNNVTIVIIQILLNIIVVIHMFITNTIHDTTSTASNVSIVSNCNRPNAGSHNTYHE